MAAPVARRAVASTLRRAAAQTVPRASTSLFAAAARRQHRRPAATPPHRQTTPALAARWYSAGPSIPDSRTWSYNEMKELLDQPDPNTVIVDVREPHELFETGKIPGAINIPITSAVQSFHIDADDFEAMYGFDRPAQDTRLVFYCKAGVRARAAAGLAAHAGWKDVGDYPGSWLEWEKEGGQVEKVVEGKGDGVKGGEDR